MKGGNPKANCLQNPELRLHNYLGIVITTDLLEILTAVEIRF